MSADARSSDATTVTPAQAARPAQAPTTGAPPGRDRAVHALFWIGLIALLVLSLGADRPEGVALALIAAGVVALRLRARRAGETPDEPVTDELPVLPRVASREGLAPPRPVVTVAVLALLQLPVLAGIGATTLVFMDALLSPTGGATPSRVTTVVVLLAFAALPTLVAAIGVWRGSEEARTALIGICWARTWISVLGCLFFFTMVSPLALVLLDVVLRRRLEDPRTQWWCALSPAPGPGSPRR